MSLIEQAPQKSKEYNDHNNRKQDHGDAAEQKALRRSPYSKELYETNRKKAENEHLKLNVDDTEYTRLTNAQKDAIADELLDEPAWVDEIVYSTEGHKIEDDSDIDPADLHYPTEAELGIKSRDEIRRAMARRVTLDVAYEDDDSGDSDYNVPVRIRNRL